MMINEKIILKHYNPLVLILNILHKFKKFKLIEKYLFLLQKLFSRQIEIHNYMKTNRNGKNKRELQTSFLNGKKHGLKKIFWFFKGKKFLERTIEYYHGKKDGWDTRFSTFQEIIYFDKNNHLSPNNNFELIHSRSKFFEGKGWELLEVYCLEGKLRISSNRNNWVDERFDDDGKLIWKSDFFENLKKWNNKISKYTS